MSARTPGDWPAAQAAFDPDGLYLALARFLGGDGAGADDAYLPYAPAADLLGGAPPAETSAPPPGPRREAVSLVERTPDGLVLYASDRLAAGRAALFLAVGDAPPVPIRPAPLGAPEEGGLCRLALPWPEAAAPAAGTGVAVRDGAVELFAGPAVGATRGLSDGRVQFRRFSGDALWFGPDSQAAADRVDGPLALAVRGEAGCVWRWGEPTLDKEGRTLWRLALDGLVRPGTVQDWDVALPGGAVVARGRFLSFVDAKDQFWLRPPERTGRDVTVTVVRDRPRQAAGLSVLLVTTSGLVLDGEAATDPPGFAFRARDNSWRFVLPAGLEPAHVSVRRHGEELFRLDRFVANRAGPA